MATAQMMTDSSFSVELEFHSFDSTVDFSRRYWVSGWFYDAPDGALMQVHSTYDTHAEGRAALLHFQSTSSEDYDRYELFDTHDVASQFRRRRFWVFSTGDYSDGSRDLEVAYDTLEDVHAHIARAREDADILSMHYSRDSAVVTIGVIDWQERRSAVTTISVTYADYAGDYEGSQG